MGSWSGPFLIAAVVLAVAGGAKAIDPTMTVGALRGVGIRVPGVVVRIGGVVETVLAIAAIVTGAPILALAVGVSYLAFTAFVLVALIRDTPIGTPFRCWLLQDDANSSWQSYRVKRPALGGPLDASG